MYLTHLKAKFQECLLVSRYLLHLERQYRIDNNSYTNRYNVIVIQ